MAVGNAGVGSDIDLIVVCRGDAQQKRELQSWLEGWSLCLAEVSFQLYGLPSSGLLDVKFLTPEQATAELSGFRCCWQNFTSFAHRNGTLTS